MLIFIGSSTILPNQSNYAADMPRKSYVKALNLYLCETYFHLNNDCKIFEKNPSGCIVILIILLWGGMEPTGV